MQKILSQFYNVFSRSFVIICILICYKMLVLPCLKHRKGGSSPPSFSWGRVDSNHRTDSRTDLQSVAIATMRLPQELKEPSLKDAAKVHLFSLPRTMKWKIFRNFALPNNENDEIRF